MGIDIEDSLWSKVAGTWVRESDLGDHQVVGVLHQGNHGQVDVLLLAPVVVTSKRSGGRVQPLHHTDLCLNFLKRLWETISSFWKIDGDVEIVITGFHRSSCDPWPVFAFLHPTEWLGKFILVRDVPLWDPISKRARSHSQKLPDYQWGIFQNCFNHISRVIFVGL